MNTINFVAAALRAAFCATVLAGCAMAPESSKSPSSGPATNAAGGFCLGFWSGRRESNPVYGVPLRRNRAQSATSAISSLSLRSYPAQ